MKRQRWMLLTAFFLAAAAASAQEYMEYGAQAYNAGNYAAAVEQFQQAVKADPQSLLARQHLANARVQLFLTTKSPFDREARMKAARQALADVLARNPKDAVALWHMAALELDLGNLEEAATWCKKLTAADPQNRNGYYTLGVIRWMDAYRAISAAKRKLGISPSEAPPINDAATRESLRSSLLKDIAEGHRSLEKALEIDSRFGGALAYDNLLYRAEAELAASPAEVQALVAKADSQLNAARALPSGIQTQEMTRVRPDQPPPACAPPPPPPPARANSAR
jgi:tetratricopeptide (TPR) repeat protein